MVAAAIVHHVCAEEIMAGCLSLVTHDICMIGVTSRTIHMPQPAGTGTCTRWQLTVPSIPVIYIEAGITIGVGIFGLLFFCHDSIASVFLFECLAIREMKHIAAVSQVGFGSTDNKSRFYFVGDVDMLARGKVCETANRVSISSAAFLISLPFQRVGVSRDIKGTFLEIGIGDHRALPFAGYGKYIWSTFLRTKKYFARHVNQIIAGGYLYLVGSDCESFAAT